MKLKNKIRIYLAILSLSLSLSLPAFGVIDLGIGGNEDPATQIAGKAGYGINVDEYSLSQTIGRVIKILLSFVGTIFFALAVYAGFLWMTAQGNEEQVAKATGIIKTAVIGMIVVLAAYSITAFALIFSAQTNQFSSNVGAPADNREPSPGTSGGTCEGNGRCEPTACQEGQNLGQRDCPTNQVCCEL